VSINLTMFAQMVAFIIFVAFCMKYVWPPLTSAMRARQKSISDGLENAARAELQLQEASESVASELEAAKQEASALVSQAHTRANQIIDEAKVQAKSEAERIVQGAQDAIDQEINQAREALREKVSELAVQGAERILKTSVDRAAHEAMLKKLASEL
jgi:F-type H+-transporting ATPase subunit b